VVIARPHGWIGRAWLHGGVESPPLRLEPRAVMLVSGEGHYTSIQWMRRGGAIPPRRPLLVTGHHSDPGEPVGVQRCPAKQSF